MKWNHGIRIFSWKSHRCLYVYVLIDCVYVTYICFRNLKQLIHHRFPVIIFLLHSPLLLSQLFIPDVRLWAKDYISSAEWGGWLKYFTVLLDPISTSFSLASEFSCFLSSCPGNPTSFMTSPIDNVNLPFSETRTILFSLLLFLPRFIFSTNCHFCYVQQTTTFWVSDISH